MVAAKTKAHRALDIVTLASSEAPDTIEKVGVLPFKQDSEGNLEFLFMKPRATVDHPGGSPSFQIAKGTRLMRYGTQSWDMGRESNIFQDKAKTEPSVDAALREGREELGLKASNIKRLFDMGVYQAESESTGTLKLLHIYAAELKNTANYFSRPESSTAEVKWLALGADDAGIKKAHIAITQDIASKIGCHLATEKSQQQR